MPGSGPALLLSHVSWGRGLSHALLTSSLKAVNRGGPAQRSSVFIPCPLPGSRTFPLHVEQRWLRTPGSLVFFLPCSSLNGTVRWDSGPGRGFPGSDPPSARAFLLSQLEPSQPGLSCPGPSSPVMPRNRRRATARQQDRVLSPVC